MITPYNPLRGIDLYIDSSGEDNWDKKTEKYYLHGLMLCSPSSEWIDWMNIHKTKFDGMIHWSAGEFGKQKLKLKDKKSECRELLTIHPWFQTAILVIDKAAFTEFFLRTRGRKIRKYEAAKSIWQTMGTSLLDTVIPHMKKLVPDDPWGCLNIRNVVINNPKGGNKSVIQNIIKSKFDRIPEFVPAGHYGIDALDGVLWAFHRCLNLGKTDCLPKSVQTFSKDLNLFVFGIASEKPMQLRNVNDINNFRNNSFQ
jgi:hypothetical protein